VSLNNLPPTILFACSAVGIGLRIGLPRPLAHLCSFALTANFIVLDQLTNNQNDVAVAACFFAAAFYIVRFIHCTGTRNVFLAGISLGLLAGVKYYASGYAVLGFGTLIMVAARLKGRRTAWEALLIGGLGVLIWGGYWYTRNFLVTGSPFYPKDLLSTSDVLSQIYPELASTSFFGNGRRELLPLYIHAIWKWTGPCQLYGFLTAPFSLVWLVGTAAAGWYRRKAKHFAWTRLTLAMLLAGAGLLLAITPYSVENTPGTLNQLKNAPTPVRYGICFLSLAMMALMIVLHDCFDIVKFYLQKSPSLRASYARVHFSSICLSLLGAVLVGAILFQILSADRKLKIDHWLCVFLGIDLVLAVIGGSMILASWPRRVVRLDVLLVVALVPASMWATYGLSQYWHNEFDSHYLNELSHIGKLSFSTKKGVDSTTFCILDYHYYPYFGSSRQNRICQPVFAPSTAWLMDYFDHKRIDFVVCRRRPSEEAKRRFLGLEECLDQFPTMFRLSFINNDRMVYQYLNSQEPETN